MHRPTTDPRDGRTGDRRTMHTSGIRATDSRSTRHPTPGHPDDAQARSDARPTKLLHATIDSNSNTDPNAKHDSNVGAVFEGFTPLTGNFVYCPNQFFDLVLPHQSRGVVRLVGYLLRRTLGWLDADGNPIEEEIRVPYQELIDRAGISRGAIRSTLDEALAARLVRCCASGRAHAAGVRGQATSVELCWDASGRFVDDPKQFAGFFTGEGRRSPIPNAFFDRVIPNEPLAVVQVVGAVLRHTVGYQNQFGGRRQQAPLSYSYLQRYTGIGGRRHLAAALRTALAGGYISCVREGTFDPHHAADSQAACYAIRWAELHPTSNEDRSPKVHPSSGGTDRISPVRSKREPDKVSPSVQKGNRANSSKGESSRAFKKGTGNGSETEPGERFNKGTTEKTITKTTSKQQQQRGGSGDAVGVAGRSGSGKEMAGELNDLATMERETARRELLRVGFAAPVANRLVSVFEPAVVLRQMAWIDRREATRNRLGLLRRAIEEDWPEPVGMDDQRSSDLGERMDELIAGYHRRVMDEARVLGDRRREGARGSALQSDQAAGPIVPASRADREAMARWVERIRASIKGDAREDESKGKQIDERSVEERIAEVIGEWADYVRSRSVGDAVGRRSLVVALRRWGESFLLERSARVLAADRVRLNRDDGQKVKELAARIEAWVEDRFARLTETELETYRARVLREFAGLTRGLADADARTHGRMMRLIKGLIEREHVSPA